MNVRVTTITTAAGKFRPVIDIDGYIYAFPLEYVLEEEAAEKAQSVVDEEKNNFITSLAARHNKWRV